MVRWARGQRLAQERIAREAQRKPLGLDEALERVDALRHFGQGFTRAGGQRSERENLAFHLTWRQVRRAYGLG